MTLNQHERAPLPVEDQTVQIFAATNGFLDRLHADRVTEFLVALTERMHSEHGPLREKIAGLLSPTPTSRDDLIRWQARDPVRLVGERLTRPTPDTIVRPGCLCGGPGRTMRSG